MLPDWPVPSSTGEVSPQNATRPLPKVLVAKKAPVVPEWPVRYSRPLTEGLSARRSVAVVPLAIRLLLTLPKGPCSTGSALSLTAAGKSEPTLRVSTVMPNGLVASTELLLIRSLKTSTAS